VVYILVFTTHNGFVIIAVTTPVFLHGNQFTLQSLSLSVVVGGLPDEAEANKCCPALSLTLESLEFADNRFLKSVYLLFQISQSARNIHPQEKNKNEYSHHKKYKPQLVALPVKLGPIPLYKPLLPIPPLLTISPNPLQICTNEFLGVECVVVETCNCTLRRSKGCIHKVETIPAVKPEKA